MKTILKKALIIFFCGVLFFGAAYMYLHFNFNKNIASTDKKDYTVPYQNLPDNAGIGFLLPDSSAVLAYLNFENGCINVVDIENYDPDNDLYYGYTVDYTVEVDYPLISGIVDRVGGINIQSGGETLRYTGAQVIDLISINLDDNIKSQVITEIFRQISKNNFSKEDFIYIIQNTKSNLSVVDCVYWLDYIDEICSNINFVT